MDASTSARWRSPLIVIGLLLAASAGLLYWWQQGRAVSIRPAPGARIACVSYAPFRRDGETPLDPSAHVSPQRIDHDLALLSHRFDCVRTYSQSLGLDAVPRIARRYGMQVLMGIWLSDDRAANAREVALGIRTAKANPATVRAIVVGNEVLLRGELSPAELAAYIRRVHAATGLPVTYADVWEFWLRYAHAGGLARAVSFVTVHILPYWENDPVPVSKAIVHLGRVYHRVREALPGKRILIGETGWPSAGKPRRGAVPSRVNEARYVRGFLRYAQLQQVPYNLIESFDQPWKRRLEGTVGGYWGLFDSAGEPKFGLQGPVREVRRWWLGWLAAGVGALLFAAVAGPGARRRCVGVLAGLAAGAALAQAGRQMAHALYGPWLWLVGVAACLLALWTALACTRHLADWLQDRTVAHADGLWAPAASSRLHALWLLATAYMDLLLVFDGRYRDYPVAAFALPAVAYALYLGLARPDRVHARVETRLLAVWLPVAAGVLLAHAHAANAEVWGWAACNGLLALPVMVAWRTPVRLHARQAQHAHQ